MYTADELILKLSLQTLHRQSSATSLILKLNTDGKATLIAVTPCEAVEDIVSYQVVKAAKGDNSGSARAQRNAGRVSLCPFTSLAMT